MCRPSLGQALHVGLALARKRQGGVELGDGFAHGGGFGLAACVLGVEFGEAGLDVLPFRLQVRVAAGAAVCAPGIERAEQGLGAAQVGLGGLELLLHARLVGAGVGRVQFHQHLAGLHAVAVAYQHALDDARIERLDRLGALAHHDAAGRDGHDIDLAEAGPEQGQGEEGAQREGGAPWRRVQRRFLQGQGCGQEGRLVGQALGAGQFVAGLPGGGEDGFVAGEHVERGVSRGGGLWTAHCVSSAVACDIKL